MSVGDVRWPKETGCSAHFAVAWSWQTTSSSGCSRYFVSRYDKQQGEMPSADELGAEFERFLADQDRKRRRD